MVTLTKNQNKALRRDVNIAVTAGAGTGKTLILVERYIDILLNEDANIKEILAITFTNKAAAEMMERVAQSIESLLSENQSEADRLKLLAIRNHLSSANIFTIHAFCARLLREFPLEAAGLDPGFSQLNDVQSEQLVEQAITEEIGSIDKNDEYWLFVVP